MAYGHGSPLYTSRHLTVHQGLSWKSLRDEFKEGGMRESIWVFLNDRRWERGKEGCRGWQSHRRRRKEKGADSLIWRKVWVDPSSVSVLRSCQTCTSDLNGNLSYRPDRLQVKKNKKCGMMGVIWQPIISLPQSLLHHVEWWNFAKRSVVCSNLTLTLTFCQSSHVNLGLPVFVS